MQLLGPNIEPIVVSVLYLPPSQSPFFMLNLLNGLIISNGQCMNTSLIATPNVAHNLNTFAILNS